MLEEREIIAQMHWDGKMQTQIAERLGRDKSTISRELRRNRSRNGYWAVAADGKARRRRSERPWVAKMQRPEVRRYVRDRLRWRP
jgi:IS30 family transposase